MCVFVVWVFTVWVSALYVVAGYCCCGISWSCDTPIIAYCTSSYVQTCSQRTCDYSCVTIVSRVV